LPERPDKLNVLTKVKRKILFISHDSSLTGAPVLLLNLLRLLAHSDLYEISILLYRGGPLENEFRKIAPTFVLKSAKYAKQKTLVLRWVNYLVYQTKKSTLKNWIGDVDLILNNTIALGPLIDTLRRLHKPIITYIHEMQSVIDAFDKKKDGSRLVIQFSDDFIVPAKVVADNLINKYEISPGRIFHLNSFIQRPPDILPSRSSFRNSFFKMHGIPENRFYVVGMGTATYRKGVDIFIETCKEATKSDKSLYFVWIGDFEDDDTRAKCMSLVSQFDIHSFIKFTGQIKHSIFALLPFDLFILTSREDPYPLVIIEAAYVKLPAICFKNSGGAAEFISRDCGWIVSDFSATALAMEIIEVKNNPEKLRERGLSAFRKGIDLHSNEELVRDQFEKIVEKVLQ
jgi:glycosyltransferase involved in cell wall biosynthesis